MQYAIMQYLSLKINFSKTQLDLTCLILFCSKNVSNIIEKKILMIMIIRQFKILNNLLLQLQLQNKRLSQ